MQKRISVFLVALIFVLPAVAEADPLGGEVGFNVAYLLAGGGPTAASTGGAMLVPTGRLLYRLQILDPYVAASPMLVAPITRKGIDPGTLGFVGALDVGVSWHAESRAWTLGTGATLAPAYMKFCNGAPWCLREGLLLYGGETHLTASLFRTVNGGGLSADVSVRVLTGKPTAWTWSRLTPEEANVNRIAGSAGGLIRWTW